jgi:hypothetical protein
VLFVLKYSFIRVFSFLHIIGVVMSRRVAIFLLALVSVLFVLGFLGFYGFIFGSVQLNNEAGLERIVVDFLKTTDVPHGVWNESVWIREIYDHKLGGKVLVAEYVTINMGHPEFMAEAIERHIAILTLNSEGRVISAFCIHGSKFWDLINQRWVHAALIPVQQAIAIGKSFLDGIGCITGQVLSTELEEKLPNFYWHNLAGLEKPDIQGLTLCWVVRFEQTYRPGHFFEVWIEAYTGRVVGGMQCR